MEKAVKLYICSVSVIYLYDGINYVYYTGLILIVFFGLINGYTGNLLIISAKRTSKKNYEALFEGIYGNFGYWMVSIFMFINDFGGDLSYLIILSDSLTYLLKLFKYDTFINRELTIIVLAFLIIFPMCIQRDLSKIEKYSFISILSVIAVIVVVIYEYFRISFTNKIFIPDNIHYFDINGIFEAMGILSFSFTYQDTSFLVYQTLFNPTILRWKLLTKLSIGTVVSLFICFSIPGVNKIYIYYTCLYIYPYNITFLTGYFTFGNSVQANIINNYPANNYLIIAIRLLYILTMSLCFTMRFFVVRHILFSIFNYGSEYSESKSIRHASKIKFLIYTIIPFLIIIGIVLIVNDLGIVMSMTGCFSSSMLSLVLPCIAYIKTYSTTKIVNETKNSYYLDIIPAILCLIFGLFIMIFSSSWTLYRYITSSIH